MENTRSKINSKKIYEIYEKLNQRYLDFTLSTTCRKNKKLYEELSKEFSKEGVLFRDLIVQVHPQYKTGDKLLSDVGFDEKFVGFIKSATPLKKPYVHQLEGWGHLNHGESCVIATGTGSGKTETFMMPILQYCINNEHKGVQVILIYPLKALAKDQKIRLDCYLSNVNNLYNTNITCGVFDGDLSPQERKEMIENPPNILITNYVMLERILIDPHYSKLLNNANIKYLVLDEIHYYSGAQGIDVSLLMRRLQFHLSLIQDIDNIQYVGTSATLGAPNSKEVSDFLKRLFNYDIKSENIISPKYSEDFKNNPLNKPTKLKDLDGKNIDLNNIVIRAHAFYRAPPNIYRCLKCGKLHITPTETCECGSNLIFEIATCRNCGEEYYVYRFSKDSAPATYNQIRRAPLKKYQGNTEEYGKLVISKENHDNSIELKLCESCHSIHKTASKCKICGSTKFLTIYSIEKGSRTTRHLKKSINDKYCPKCGFDGHAHEVIRSIGDLSDEYCSKVLFDEAFLALPEPDKKRKLLVFTDNVQRASRFARLVEEYHLEKIIRKKLYDEIKELRKPKKIRKIVQDIIDELEDEMDISNYETQFKSILYNELLAKGSNVNALANKGIFKINLVDDKIPTDYKNSTMLNAVIDTFIEKRQIKEYYSLIMEGEENYEMNGFFTDDDLKNRIYKKCYGVALRYDNDNNRTNKLRRIGELLGILYDEQIIIREDNKYLMRGNYLEVVKLKELSEEYLNEWDNYENLSLLISAVDTGKTSAEERKYIESSFKKDKVNSINCLVATPTLELGIDIGDLNMVGLLHSPPSPAQYVQRIGRCGRRGSSSIGITFFSKNAIDANYYEKAIDLILGNIKPPSFSIDLELPLSKSFFSLFMYYLLNETKFIDEITPKKWDNVQTWESLFESKIKLLWKKYELGFYNFLENYFEITNIDRSECELVDVWIEKFEEFIEFQKRITKEGKNRNLRKQNIYNYFQEAGLLPDYAFGSGGPKLIIKSKSDNTIKDIIMGYRLEEICPPSTLDHGKARYTCEKIWMRNALKTVASKFKECKSCNNNIIFTKPGINKCPLCGSPLIQVDREIKEPRIIEGKKSYVKKPRKVAFEKRVFDLPENLKANGLVSQPFSCEVGSFFLTGVRGGETKPCVYCENCGRITFREDEKCCRYSRGINPSFTGTGRTIIGTKFKTRGVIVNIPNAHRKTLLNALIAAAVLEAGCEPGEIDGIEDAVDGKLLLFDNVEGGVGFVDVIYNRLKDVLKTAKRLCEMDCCQNGCIKCIGSYWRQHEIPMLRKREAITNLDKMINKL